MGTRRVNVSDPSSVDVVDEHVPATVRVLGGDRSSTDRDAISFRALPSLMNTSSRREVCVPCTAVDGRTQDRTLNHQVRSVSYVARHHARP